ncbi:hypothetical protein SADUNF_Sadunf16G0165900 [Salix dunnii]|uniref:CCT domain-containing protein n=1 Tax=Salix dunnii TaxID=1413687 RepID=A0A835MLZ8_9ROSI|nr:hypothetical protein SADUNF_Sadunf16G0165900 [Salix dunnii]
MVMNLHHAYSPQISCSIQTCYADLVPSKKCKTHKRKRDRMKYNSFLRSPKKEEQEVPDTVVTQFSIIKEEANGNGEIDVMDELEGIFGTEHDEMLSNDKMYGRLSWDFMDLEEYPAVEDEQGSEMFKFDDNRSSFFEFEESHYSIGKVIKEESVGFGDGDEKGMSLNLNLNYQEVMEAWSDRGPLLADDHSLPMASSDNYVSTLSKLIILLPFLSALPFELYLGNGKSLMITCMFNRNDFKLRNCCLLMAANLQKEKDSKISLNTDQMGEVPVMEDRTRREASVLRYKEKRQTRLFSKKIRYQVRKLNAEKRPRLKGRFVKRVS